MAYHDHGYWSCASLLSPTVVMSPSGLRPLRCIPDCLRKAAACCMARRALGAADGNVDLPRIQRAGCFVARWRRSNYREGTTLTEAVVSGLVRNCRAERSLDVGWTEREGRRMKEETKRFRKN